MRSRYHDDMTEVLKIMQTLTMHLQHYLPIFPKFPPSVHGVLAIYVRTDRGNYIHKNTISYAYRIYAYRRPDVYSL